MSAALRRAKSTPNQAIEGVYALAEAGRLELTWSFMLDYENGLNPHPDRKEWVELPYVYGYNCPIATNSNFGSTAHEAAKVQTKGCASRGVRPTRWMRLLHYLRRYIDPTRVERWSSVGASSESR
jgi:hypothetical protein